MLQQNMPSLISENGGKLIARGKILPIGVMHNLIKMFRTDETSIIVQCNDQGKVDTG
jgi:hypothetical protein